MYALGLFILSIIQLIIRGVALAYLWAWFITPLGMRDITIPNAIGLVIIIHLFNSVTKQDLDNLIDREDCFSLQGFDFLRTIFVFLFGGTLHWIIGLYYN